MVFITFNPAPTPSINLLILNLQCRNSFKCKIGAPPPHTHHCYSVLKHHHHSTEKCARRVWLFHMNAYWTRTVCFRLIGKLTFSNLFNMFSYHYIITGVLFTVSFVCYYLRIVSFTVCALSSVLYIRKTEDTGHHSTLCVIT